MASIISSQSIRETGELNGHQLLIDVMPLKVVKNKIISEDIHGNKRHVLKLTGQIQHADKPNANGRIYPLAVLKEAINSVQDDVKNRRMLSELDHSSDAKIHLDRVSHVMTKIWMEGPIVYGELEVLPTICGKQLQALVENNINVGISSRGVGDMTTESVDGNEYYKVTKGYQIIGFDIVGEPSVAGSYLSLMEGRERLKTVQNSRQQKEQQVLKALKQILNENIR